MIIEKIYDSAKPYLKGKQVKDLVVGISLIACELSNGDVGTSYVLRDDLANGCGAFPYAKEVIGQSAEEIAGWCLDAHPGSLRSTIAQAVLTAASQSLDLPDDDEQAPFGLEPTKEDTICMVGLVKPVAVQLSKKAGKFYVFDKGIEMHGGDDTLTPMELQSKLMPTCTIAILSGTTVTNKTIGPLLELCKSATEIVIVGPSTPMYPEGFAGTNVTKLAGSWWKNEKKEEIFKAISLACGVSHIQAYMLKKCADV
ncbi:MAG: DUF364 domain-containing protein [Eubacteriaceae bacterium]|nr:DUF364 domain-containing protein [Eubacteriaceae bacterium]